MDITTEALYDFTTVLVITTIFCTATALAVWMICMGVYECILYKHDQRLREEHFQSLRRAYMNQPVDPCCDNCFTETTWNHYEDHDGLCPICLADMEDDTHD
jgi:uncharacterized ion transporter superfamily protein YfcC